MATNKVPYRPARLVGEEIARIRTSRGLSRSALIKRIYKILDDEDPILKDINESWLKRIESGERVNLSRRMIEVLCEALACTDEERARILLYADRSIFNDGKDPDRLTEALCYLVGQVHKEAHEFLSNRLGDRRKVDLDDQEVFELVIKGLELAIKHLQRDRQNRIHNYEYRVQAP